MSSENVDLVWNDEYKDKLKGLLAFDVSATFPYVPKKYREAGVPKQFWPVFTLKSKDGLEISTIEDEAGFYQVSKDGNHKMCMRSGSVRIMTLRKGIKSWKNMRDENGKVISFDPKKHTDDEGLTDSAIRLIPVALQVDLQNAINERSTLTEEEKTGLEY